MTNEELALAVQAGQNVAENMAQLYEQNRGMIYKLTEKYRGIEDPEDLRQECYFGLVQAVKTWEAARDVSFISYAVPCMKTQILRYISTCGAVVRIPASRRALIAKYEQVSNAFRRDLGRGPTPQELRILIGIDSEQLKQLRKDIRLLKLQSTNKPIGDSDDGGTLEDMIPAEGDQYEDILEKIYHEETSRELWGQVDKLPEQERDVIRARFKNSLTLKQCGEALGVSTERVRQLQEKALRRLRAPKIERRLSPYLSDDCAYSLGLRSNMSAFRNFGATSQEAAMMLLELRTGLKLTGGKLE